MSDAGSGDLVLNGDAVRNVKFPRGGFYNVWQVNALLDRIAAELDAGRPVGPLIANAMFASDSFVGYEAGAVDWFLERLRHREDPADPWRDLAADPYYIRREPGDPAGRVARPSKQECRDAWESFGRQPGTRLQSVRGELRTEDQQMVVTVTGLGWRKSVAVTAGGRTFQGRRVPGSWRDIIQAIGRDHPSTPAHLERRADHRDIYLRQFLQESGEPVLYTGGGPVARYIKFPGQRWLRFPVRGTGLANAIMTAVDQGGNKIARYRLVQKTTEITLHPGQQLTGELALAIAISAPWLRSRFVQ
jgi:DivIVA domain-containing protein